jgi:ATP-dependent Clp protease ATP-binding subunit ClpC
MGRFAGFSFRARKVMQLANQEAHRLNHECIGTEHLVLGLVKDHVGLASKLLQDAGLCLKRARDKVGRMTPASSGVLSGRLPLTTEIEQTIELAASQAKELQHAVVGTGHLLLSVLLTPETKATQVLSDAIRKLEKFRAKLLQSLARTNWTIVEDHSERFFMASVPSWRN